MNREEALKKSDEALKDLATTLQQGKSDALVKYLEMLSRFHNYSFGNCILIAMQMPHATHVAGFQRWKSMGRYVKKEEKGIGILAPLAYRRRKDEQPEDGKEPDDRPSSTLRGFRVVHVFDVSQTDGEPIPEFADLGGDPGEKLHRVENLIRAKGIAFEFVDSLGGAHGVSEGGAIKVVESLPVAQKFSTMCHELAHELLHRGDRRSLTTKVIRETEAEAVAYVVCRSVGLDCSTHASDYIQLWNGDVQVLMQSLELIRDVATLIITALDESESVAEEVSHVA